MSLNNALQPLKARWIRLPGRQKMLIQLAALLVLVLGFWQFTIAPALVTVRTSKAQSKVLSAQLQQMQAMQIQAQSMQKQPALGFDEAVRALTATTKQTLGTNAQVGVAGERASVTVKGVPADVLAEWLAQARLNARSVPLEARLLRAAAPAAAEGAIWDGVLVMGLPAR